MAEQLFPVFEPPEDINEIQTTEAVRYKKSFLFDFDAGDFVTDGANKVQESDGYTAWAQWCMKVAKTSRYAFLAYSSDIGIEDEEIRTQPNRTAAELTYERTITEALMIHPGTESVREFEFVWNGDNMNTNFSVYPKEGAPIIISTGVSV